MSRLRQSIGTRGNRTPQQRRNLAVGAAVVGTAVVATRAGRRGAPVGGRNTARRGGNQATRRTGGPWNIFLTIGLLAIIAGVIMIAIGIENQSGLVTFGVIALIGGFVFIVIGSIISSIKRKARIAAMVAGGAVVAGSVISGRNNRNNQNNMQMQNNQMMQQNNMQMQNNQMPPNQMGVAMFCQNCGTQGTQGQFCINCGTQV